MLFLNSLRVAVLLSVFLFSGLVAAATCNDSVTDAYVQLDSNVTALGTCFNVTADDVDLDCNGYAVHYANGSWGYTGHGVKIDGRSNVTVRNCVFYSNETLDDPPRPADSHAVYVVDSDNVNVSYNRVFQRFAKDSYFVYVAGDSFDVNVSHNFGAAVLANNNNFLTIVSGYGFLVNNNSFTATVGSVSASIIKLTGSVTNSSFFNNTFNSTSGKGVVVDASLSNSSFYDDFVYASNIGLELWNSFDNAFRNNYVFSESDWALFLASDNNSVYSSNYFESSSTGRVIVTDATSNATFINSTVNQSNAGVTGYFSSFGGVTRFVDSKFYNSSAFPDGVFYLSGAFSNASFHNCSFNAGLKNFTVGANDWSNKLVNVSFEGVVRTIDSGGAALASASVNVTTKWGESVLNATTNATGYTSYFNSSEYVVNFTGAFNFTPHFVNASKAGYNDNESTYSFTDAGLRTVALTLFATSSIAVTLNSPADNNKSRVQNNSFSFTPNAQTNAIVNCSLLSNASASYFIAQSIVTGSDYIQLGGSRWLAQSFNASENITIENVSVYLGSLRGSNCAGGGCKLNLSIYNNSVGNTPDTSLTNNYSVTETASNWINFTFSYAINASTRYWIVLKQGSGAGGSDGANMGGSASNAYSNGNANLSTDSGATWSASGLADLGFYVYASNWSLTQANQTTIANNSANYVSYNFSKDGDFLWGIQCFNNESTVFYSVNRTISVDATSPKTFAFVSPTQPDGQVISFNWVYINATFNESHSDSCWIDLSNGTALNYSLSLSAGSSDSRYAYGNFTGQPEGVNITYVVYCNDSFGNVGASVNRSIYVNSAYPSVYLNSPSNGAVTAETTINFSFTPSSAGALANATLFHSCNSTGGWSNYSFNVTTVFNGSVNEINVTGLPVLSCVWNVLACDSVGRCSFAPTNFSLAISSVGGGGGGGGGCALEGVTCFIDGDCCGGLVCGFDKKCVKAGNLTLNFIVYPSEITPPLFSSVRGGALIRLSDVYVLNSGNKTLKLNARFKCTQAEGCAAAWCALNLTKSEFELSAGEVEVLHSACRIPLNASNGLYYATLVVEEPVGGGEQGVRVTIRVGAEVVGEVVEAGSGFVSALASPLGYCVLNCGGGVVDLFGVKIGGVSIGFLTPFALLVLWVFFNSWVFLALALLNFLWLIK